MAVLDTSLYRVAQKSFSLLVKHIVKYILNDLLLAEFTKLFSVRQSIFKAQLIKLCERFIN
jgi:hypothetical protein